jgi:hypothetical protein
MHHRRASADPERWPQNITGKKGHEVLLLRLFILLRGFSELLAAVRLPSLIGEHMVIQCNMLDSI